MLGKTQEIKLESQIIKSLFSFFKNKNTPNPSFKKRGISSKKVRKYIFRNKISKKEKLENKKKFKTHKEKAREIVMSKLEHFKNIYKTAHNVDIKYNRVTIRDQKTRWGSCSSKGNLNFNYRLALIPDHLADYVIVHEMCHILQLNHSQKFWSLVSLAIPDYIEKKAELRSLSL